MAISYPAYIIIIDKSGNSPAELSTLRTLCEKWIEESKPAMAPEPQYGEDDKGITVALNETVSEAAFHVLSERVKAAFAGNHVHAEKMTGEMLDAEDVRKLLRGESYEVRKRETLN